MRSAGADDQPGMTRLPRRRSLIEIVSRSMLMTEAAG
jgi:hypothetical protein